MTELIENINAILDIKTNLPINEKNKKSKTQSINQIITEIESLMKNQKSVLKDEQGLFSGDWGIFIKSPLKNLDKLESLIIKFKHKKDQVCRTIVINLSLYLNSLFHSLTQTMRWNLKK